MCNIYYVTASKLYLVILQTFLVRVESQTGETHATTVSIDYALMGIKPTVITETSSGVSCDKSINTQIDWSEVSAAIVFI